MSFTIGEIVGPSRSPEAVAPAVKEVACPTGKVAFASKRLARQALRLIPDDGPSTRSAYRCAFCFRHHVGHRRGALL